MSNRKPMSTAVVAVHSKVNHAFSKVTQPFIELVEGHGVRSDAHFGVTVKHRSRVARDPNQPNLRQVHLLHQELFCELAARGFEVTPGQMGENITTGGIDLLGLAVGTRLRLSAQAIVQITGLRNPCSQIEAFKPGLLAAVLERTPNGKIVRKAGVMGIVICGGPVQPGSEIVVVSVPTKFIPLQPV